MGILSTTLQLVGSATNWITRGLQTSRIDWIAGNWCEFTCFHQDPCWTSTNQDHDTGEQPSILKDPSHKIYYFNKKWLEEELEKERVLKFPTASTQTQDGPPVPSGDDNSVVGIPESDSILNESADLSKLKHITFQGISKVHIGYILKNITEIQELILIFSEVEGSKINLWDEFTGGAPKSWSDIYDTVFQDFIDEFKPKDWENLSSESDGESSDAEFDKIFRDCFQNYQKFPVYPSSCLLQGKQKDFSSTLENMKNLELLKIIGCNRINFEAIFYMTYAKKMNPLKNLQLEFISGFKPDETEVYHLRQYHIAVETMQN